MSIPKQELWNPVKDQLRDADMLISIGIRRLLEIDPDLAEGEELESYLEGFIESAIRYANLTKELKRLRESHESTPISNG